MQSVSLILIGWKRCLLSVLSNQIGLCSQSTIRLEFRDLHFFFLRELHYKWRSSNLCFSLTFEERALWTRQRKGKRKKTDYEDVCDQKFLPQWLKSFPWLRFKEESGLMFCDVRVPYHDLLSLCRSIPSCLDFILIVTWIKNALTVGMQASVSRWFSPIVLNKCLKWKGNKSYDCAYWTSVMCRMRRLLNFDHKSKKATE